jgi:spore coat protein JB
MHCNKFASVDGEGRLPASAPLANPYVPFQNDHPAKYESRKATVRGTLFPGLDLPFMGMVNKNELPVSPMTELQVMNFVLQELALYLDTHPDDTEAFTLFKQFTAMEKTAREAWEKANGPIKRSAAAQGERWDWLKDPWPWNYEHNEVK